MIQGLTNIGNTCYMNSVLQMLYKLEDLMIDIDSIFSNSKENSFLITYYLIEIYHDINLKKIRKEMLSQFHEIICTQYPQFQTYQQQDAQEFLLALLELLHQELRNPLCEKEFRMEANEKLPLAIKKYKTYLEYENSPISRKFGTMVRMGCKCQECQDISWHLEIQNCLNLSVNRKYQTIREMVKSEYDMEEVRMFCSKCKRQCKFQKSQEVVYFPPHVLLSINRYEKSSGLMNFMGQQHIEKSTRALQITEQLKLGEKIYAIHGIIDHLGKSDGGHYRYYHLSGNDWLCLDDYKWENY